MFGAEHPIANCQHLRRKIAWHVQAAKEGGLPESVRQYAIAIAREAELRVRISENVSRRLREIPLEHGRDDDGGSSRRMPGCRCREA